MNTATAIAPLIGIAPPAWPSGSPGDLLPGAARRGDALPAAPATPLAPGPVRA